MASRDDDPGIEVDWVPLHFRRWSAARAGLSRDADHVFFALILKAYMEWDGGRVLYLERLLAAWCKMPREDFLEALAELQEAGKVSKKGKHLIVNGVRDRQIETVEKIEGKRSRTAAARAARAAARSRGEGGNSLSQSPDRSVTEKKSSVTEPKSPHNTTGQGQDKPLLSQGGSARGGDPAAAVYAHWNDTAARVGWPEAARTGARTRRINGLLSQCGDDAALITGIIDRAAGSAFLRSESRFNPTLDWLATNAEKIGSGAFDDRPGARGRGSKAMAALGKARHGDDG